MPQYPKPLERLVEALRRLPGIGEKSATRIAFHLLRISREEAEVLAASILDLKDSIRSCGLCSNLSDTDPCSICGDPARDSTIVCVVEEPANLLAIERTGEYQGKYHVLLGTLSPMRGVGPEQLKIQELLRRIEPEKISEIILATNPNVEGEATAVYLSRLLKPLGVRVTRIAQGVPVGGDIEYADEVTMVKAMEGRRDF